METIKCKNCGKCFTVIGDQENCPFCKQPLSSECDVDIPDFLKNIFNL